MWPVPHKHLFSIRARKLSEKAKAKSLSSGGVATFILAHFSLTFLLFLYQFTVVRIVGGRIVRPLRSIGVTRNRFMVVR